MIGKLPKFVDSPYFKVTKDGWALEPNAPQEIIDEFNAYFESRKTTQLEMERLSNTVKDKPNDK